METQKDQDKQLLCQDCQLLFAWTAGEQRFYREKDFTQPKRCPSCRAYLKRKIKESERGREVGDGR